MAESEHRRWCDERRADGWTRGHELDVQEKRHPDLVPWSELSEARRVLDVEAQRELPVLLARYGPAIVRKQRPLTEIGPAPAELSAHIVSAITAFWPCNRFSAWS